MSGHVTERRLGRDTELLWSAILKRSVDEIFVVRNRARVMEEARATRSELFARGGEVLNAQGSPKSGVAIFCGQSNFAVRAFRLHSRLKACTTTDLDVPATKDGRGRTEGSPESERCGAKTNVAPDGAQWGAGQGWHSPRAMIYHRNNHGQTSLKEHPPCGQVSSARHDDFFAPAPASRPADRDFKRLRPRAS